MMYQSFHDKFPTVAEAETKSVVFLQENEYGVPVDSYLFVELFCNDKKCDCRRVFLEVYSDPQKYPVAVICWGWEPVAFYRKWLGFTDKEILIELKGPALNSGSYQSPIAPALLKYASEILLKDKDYTDRIQRHYTMFKKKTPLKFH